MRMVRLNIKVAISKLQALSLTNASNIVASTHEVKEHPDERLACSQSDCASTSRYHE